QKRFSATQYALFSSLFGLPRLVAGPVSGLLVDALGWRTFYLLTLVAGVPGMVLLARFVPLGVREPAFTVAPPRRREPLSAGQLMLRRAAGGALAFAASALVVATLAAMKTTRAQAGAAFDLRSALAT